MNYSPFTYHLKSKGNQSTRKTVSCLGRQHDGQYILYKQRIPSQNEGPYAMHISVQAHGT